MKIICKNKNIELSKEFYHEHIFVDTCPKCGNKEEQGKATSAYFNYPVTNQGMAINFRCQNCEHEWDQWIKIKMEIVDANAEE